MELREKNNFIKKSNGITLIALAISTKCVRYN